MLQFLFFSRCLGDHTIYCTSKESLAMGDKKFKKIIRLNHSVTWQIQSTNDYATNLHGMVARMARRARASFVTIGAEIIIVAYKAFVALAPVKRIQPMCSISAFISILLRESNGVCQRYIFSFETYLKFPFRHESQLTPSCLDMIKSKQGR